jgi:hypothetical protein
VERGVAVKHTATDVSGFAAVCRVFCSRSIIPMTRFPVAPDQPSVCAQSPSSLQVAVTRDNRKKPEVTKIPVGADRKEHLRNRFFVPFILDLVQDAGCDTGPALLYGALACCLDKYRKIPFGESRKVLAKMLGVGPRTITRWLSCLKQTKNGQCLIKVEQINRMQANRFQLLNRTDSSKSYRTRNEVLAGRRYIAVPDDILQDPGVTLLTTRWIKRAIRSCAIC